MTTFRSSITRRASRPTRRRSRVAVVGVTSLLLVLPVAAPSPAASAARDPNVIAEWNSIALSTFGADPTKRPTETFLYTAFVQAAVYDAVVSIHRRYEPYSFAKHAKRPASSQAAAVAAAHKVLVTYAPHAQAALDSAYATSLAAMPVGPVKRRGIRFGTAAADHLIAMRANDGRNGPALFTQPPAPGVWRPTPPANLPMFTPWMGAVTPLLIRRGAQFDPGPPPAMASAEYARQFDEVKALGRSTGSTRTAAQTATAMFYSGNGAVQFNEALRPLIASRHLGIVDTARMYAAVNMSMADAIIAAWNSKLKYGFWRPITAINQADTDGNPSTTADPSWTPLIANPPYPDYVSGYSGLAGAFARSLRGVFGTRHLDITLISTAVPGVTRSYHSVNAMVDEVVDARVWLGIHFRSADTSGAQVGQSVAAFAMDRYFERRERRG